MEQGDWQNDADYPHAPLPAHERTWRHPSEVGSAHWVQSEPPLVVGRGLSVATGTVGAVLAIGLLWLIVPHPGRGSDVALESSTTSVRTVAIATTASADTEPITVIDGQPSTRGSASNQPFATTDSTDPVVNPTTTSALTTTPMPTMVLDVDTSATASIPAIAVALMPGHYVVTTAAAVRGREGLAVLLPSGVTVVGAVVSVDIAHGTAVLSVGTDIDDAMIEPSDAEIGSSTFVVMTPLPTTARIWVDQDGTQVGYEGDATTSAGEGSVVLDGSGRLVGLCTKSTTGTRLVTVANLLDALVSATSMNTPAWLGVDYDLDSAGNVVVTRVLSDGPARAAGIRIGDAISAVDGVLISDLETLRAALNSHVAGDTVMLTVTPAASQQTSTTTASTDTTVVTPATVAASSTSEANGTATTVNTAGNTAGIASSAATTTSVTATSARTSAPGPLVDVAVVLAPPPGTS